MLYKLLFDPYVKTIYRNISIFDFRRAYLEKSRCLKLVRDMIIQVPIMHTFLSLTESFYSHYK